MTASTQILNREQLAFLESNFVVYDPLFHECYQDFSGLENCQVIFIGEFHDSSVLKTIQRQFLEIIIGNRPACIVAEGLAPGVTLNAQELPQGHRWHALPLTTELRGADVRAQAGAAQFIEREKLNAKILQWELDQKARETTSFRQLARMLNFHFTSGSFLGIDNIEKVFFVTDDILEAVEQFIERNCQESVQRYEEIVESKLQSNQMAQELFDRSHTAAVRSNVGLFEEIEKTCRQFSVVIGMWGKAHFTHDNSLMRALDRAQISYVILFPNEQRKKETRDDATFANGTLPMCTLRLGVEEKTLNYTMPKMFQSYLHPALQAICISEKEDKPVVLDVRKLIELSLEGNSLEFPAGKVVLLEHVPMDDFDRLIELLEQKTELTEKVKIEKKSHLVSILNNILMLSGAKVDSLTLEGSIDFDYGLENKPVLALISDKPIFLKASLNKMQGYANNLFRDMKRLNVREYSLSPEEQLIFLDVSVEEIDRILESPKRIVEWMESKLPPRTQLKLEGDFSPSAVSIQPFEGAAPLPALVLTTETGVTINLV